mgnify:CR=1 FL=1
MEDQCINQLKITTTTNPNVFKCYSWQQSLQLEIALNKSEYAREWIHIGKVLYDYAMKRGEATLLVNDIQYNFLVNHIGVSHQ